MDGPRSQDQAVSLRLVRFAEHSLFDRPRFRDAGAGAEMGDRTQDFPARSAHSQAPPEPAGGSRGVFSEEVAQAFLPVLILDRIFHSFLSPSFSRGIIAKQTPQERIPGLGPKSRCLEYMVAS